jgi:hypothetical protein
MGSSGRGYMSTASGDLDNCHVQHIHHMLVRHVGCGKRTSARVGISGLAVTMSARWEIADPDRSHPIGLLITHHLRRLVLETSSGY